MQIARNENSERGDEKCTARGAQTVERRTPARRNLTEPGKGLCFSRVDRVVTFCLLCLGARLFPLVDVCVKDGLVDRARFFFD